MTIEARSASSNLLHKIDLDDVSLGVLRLLSRNPRRGIASIARELGVSAPTVRDRLDHLEQTGVIRAIRLDIDPRALGLPVSAWVRIKPGPGQLAKVTDLIRQLPSVSECHRVTGDDCLLARVHAGSVELLETVLDQFLRYGQTSSAIIVSTPVPPRGLLQTQHVESR